MKSKLLIALSLLLIKLGTSAQNLNVTLRGQLAYPGQTCANICGYVDSVGNEYALVGASVGLSIVNITDPTNPTQVYQHVGPTGSSSLWQEIKVRGKFAYVTTEAGGGLQIFNLRSLPDVSGITVHSWTGDGAIAGQLNTIHALHIDNNFVYLYGSNLFSGGALVADLTDPWNPTYAGHYSQGTGNAQYVHDGYVRNDTLYAGHIYQGYFSVVDFTNKANPIELATQFTPNHFTHNTWLSENSKTLFTTDEVSNSFLASYDISNLANIVALDKIQSNPGSGSIVHNVHIIKVNGNEYAVTSWYRDGFTIVDVGRPSNLVQVANYDSYPSGSGDGFDGDWGVFPFFPSGNIVVSNIDEGLFVYTPNYVRACYLEGIVTDSITGLAINNASIQLLSVTDNSNFAGNYATGIPSPGGTYTVIYSKPGYHTKTITGVNLSAGVVTLQNVALSPLTTFAFGGQVIDASTSAPIANATVSVKNHDFNYQTTTDVSGNFNLPSIYPYTYDIVAGQWGYETNCSQTLALTPSSGNIAIPLTKGYYDDFTFDFGWTVASSATTGMWERGLPLGTEYNGVGANPGIDDSTDCTNMAYVTGNTGITSSDQDVDNGATTLTSPLFDLSTYSNPVLNFSYWFLNAGGSGTPNDSLRVSINNGTTTSQLFFANVATPNSSSWVQKAIAISPIINLTNTMKLIVRTADINPGHIVEAGFDKFRITEGTNGIAENKSGNESQLCIYPNPTNATIMISMVANKHKAQDLKIIDYTGRVLMHLGASSVLASGVQGWMIDLTYQAKGVYFVQVQTDYGVVNKKIIKQ